MKRLKLFDMVTDVSAKIFSDKHYYLLLNIYFGLYEEKPQVSYVEALSFDQKKEYM